MQGVFINRERPETKEALRKAIEQTPGDVVIEQLQFFGNEYYGPLDEMPDGTMAGVVGPDPFIARDWYATILKRKGKVYFT